MSRPRSRAGDGTSLTEAPSPPRIFRDCWRSCARSAAALLPRRLSRARPPAPSMPAPRSSASAATAIARARSLVRFSPIAGSLVAAGLAVPATAQVAVEAALQTDYRVRGYSINDEKPAASLSVSYDDPSGTYVGGSLIGST